MNRVATVTYRRPDRKLADMDRKREPVPANEYCGLQSLRPGRRSPDDELLFAALQAQSAKQPGEAQVVIGMEVCNEDLSHREPNAETHHLPLRSFSAVEQIQVPLPLNRESGDISPDGRPRGRGPQERDT